MDPSDRLSHLYPGMGTGKGKFFSEGQPTLFMSFTKQLQGQTNQAFERDGDDSDEKDKENKNGGDSENPRNTRDSYVKDNESENSRDSRDTYVNDKDSENSRDPRDSYVKDNETRYVKDNETPSTSRASSEEFQQTPELSQPPPQYDVLENGGPRSTRVNFQRSQDPNEPSQTQQTNSGQSTQKRWWDIFRSSAKDAITSEADIKFWNKVFVVTKFVICIFLFFLVFGTAVISKISFIIITSNIHLFSLDNDTARTLLRTARGNLEFPGDINRTNVLWIWSLLAIMGAPYLFITGKCTWRLYFQMTKRKAVTLSTLLPTLLMETLHSIGLMVMVFLVIPSLDPISGLLYTLTIAVVPGLLKIWFPRTKKEKGKEGTMYLLQTIVGAFSIVAAAGQIGAIGLWCYHIYSVDDSITNSIPLIVCMICAPIFVSATWWENYVYQGKKDSSGLPLFARSIRKRRTKLLLFTSLWKLVLVIVVPIIISAVSCEGNGTKCIRALYRTENEATLRSSLMSTTFETKTSFQEFGTCNNHLPIIVATVSILSSIVCFKAAKVACKIMTQVVDFSLPLVLSTPAAIGIVLGMYSGFLKTSDGCSLPFPRWNSTMSHGSAQYFTDVADHWEVTLPIIAGLVGFLSFLLVTNHIWLPGKTRLQRTDMLFIQPLYCGILTDQSLLLNRRRVESEVRTSDTVHVKTTNLPLPDDEIEHDVSSNKSPYSTDDTPMIYMCATMWHENENEMTQLLKSIFRMDEDQCTRKNYQMMFHRRDPDYYEFEAHIFFDDAFEGHRDDEYDFTVNTFVKDLIKTVQLSASAIMGVTFKMSDPKKVATPYGGRLVWSLPGGNTLVAHLKDRTIIRHRKRWSQVMYMYYFLGYKLLNQGLTRRVLERRAGNTFLLALDGDVDFYPPAVQLLVDRMRKNPLVGAACGRIHPVGNGAMVWYQKFEYAVSHWLQKAAEDKIGCVLCSPGCFSLFRGSALMDDNVMNRYTTPPTEPRHYVQYDQGEDRWLCTLLLQQGHRVEYCAASDAVTYAPEGFYEFFNQRRRWTPSTMANIMDLLTDWRNVTKRNPEISVIYVFYQGLLMVSSILTPGTIFLLILGAINLAYPDINLWVAFVLNIIPVAVMVTLCFISKPQVQLSYAGILSTAYSLVMMIVLVGLLRQAADYGFCSVTTMFLLFVAGVFIISALLHPQEFWCLLHGCLYFLAIPAMSMVLMLYSLGNLHVVTWGTRENKQPTGGSPQEKKPQDQVLTWLERLFMCCRGKGRKSEENTLRMILDRLDAIEDNQSTIRSERSGHSSMMARFSETLPRSKSRSPSLPMMMPSDDRPFSAVSDDIIGGGLRTNQLYEEEQQRPRNLLQNPYWMTEDGVMKKFRRGQPLEADEVTFWKELIETYLQPLEGDAQKQKQTQKELIELRNKVCLIFILINSLFIIIVFTLQQVTAGGGSLTVHLPCAESGRNGSDTDTNPQAIEPISVAFTLVFGILLLVQFLCMLVHRFATLLHILASTTIFKGKKFLANIRSDPESGATKTTEKAITFEEGYELVRELQSNKDDECSSVASTTPSEAELSELDDDLAENETKRQRVKDQWKKLAERRRNLMKRGNTLNANFRKNFFKIQEFMKEDHLTPRQEDESVTGEERDEESIINELQKKKDFQRLNHKSIRTITEIRQNPSLKKSIAVKKVKGWDVVRNKLLGGGQGRKFSNVVENAMRQHPRSGSIPDMSPNTIRKGPIGTEGGGQGRKFSNVVENAMRQHPRSGSIPDMSPNTIRKGPIGTEGGGQGRKFSNVVENAMRQHPRSGSIPDMSPNTIRKGPIGTEGGGQGRKFSNVVMDAMRQNPRGESLPDTTPDTIRKVPIGTEGGGQRRTFSNVVTDLLRQQPKCESLPDESPSTLRKTPIDTDSDNEQQVVPNNNPSDWSTVLHVIQPENMKQPPLASSETEDQSELRLQLPQDVYDADEHTNYEDADTLF